MDAEKKKKLEALLIQFGADISDADKQEWMHNWAPKDKTVMVNQYVEKISALIDSTTDA